MEKTLTQIAEDIKNTVVTIRNNKILMDRINNNMKLGLLLHKVSTEYGDRNYERSEEHLNALVAAL